MSVRSRVECPKYDQILVNKAAKSSIWQYFGNPGDVNGKILSTTVSLCLICKCAVSSRATSNLWSHMKCHHQVRYLKLRKKIEIKDPTLVQPALHIAPKPAPKLAPKPALPQTKKQESGNPKRACEDDDFEMSGRRIVDVGHFFQQLMRLNKHGPPGCSLNNMSIVSETRRGLATEITFMCSKCSFVKSIWTEDVSSQWPLSLERAAVTGTIGIRNGLSAMEEFLDVLNVPSVSINTTYAAKRDGRAPEKTPRKEEPRAGASEKQEDAETEGFTVVVKGAWVKKRPPLPQAGQSSEKPPDMKADVELMELEPSPLTVTVTPPDDVVELDPTAEATSEVILPDLSEPGPSSRRDSSMTDQDVHMALTCDNYPVQVSGHGATPKIKEEPRDPDACKPNSSASLVQENRLSSNDSSSSHKFSLFHPPVLIKEEPVYLEE